MDWEISILEWFRTWETPVLDAFFRLSNWIGRGERIAIFIIIGIWRHLANRQKAWAIFWPVTGVVALTLIKSLKKFIGRDRPDLWGEYAIHVDPGSMPSGHAVGACLFLSLLAIYWSRRVPSRKLVFWLVACAGMIWINVGRLYFGVHWPTDVLAGSAIGLVAAALLKFLVLDRPAFQLSTPTPSAPSQDEPEVRE